MSRRWLPTPRWQHYMIRERLAWTWGRVVWVLFISVFQWLHKVATNIAYAALSLTPSSPSHNACCCFCVVLCQLLPAHSSRNADGRGLQRVTASESHQPNRERSAVLHSGRCDGGVCHWRAAVLPAARLLHQHYGAAVCDGSGDCAILAHSLVSGHESARPQLPLQTQQVPALPSLPLPFQLAVGCRSSHVM
jgi:hypothetical protein